MNVNKVLTLPVWLLLAVSVWGQTDTLNKAVKLSEVVVFDTKSEQQFDFYRSSRLSSTEDVLSRMQGVNLIRRGNYGLEPSIRQFSANQITLTIDGMRMYGACTDRMDPVSIYVEPINMQQLSVQHGSEGMAFGSSIGGNINLKLKTPKVLGKKETFVYLAQLYQSNHQAIASSFAIEQHFKKWGIRLSGIYRNANDYTSGNDSLVKHSAFEKYNMAGSVTYVINPKHSLEGQYLYDEGRYIGYPALPMDVGIASAHIGSITHQYAWKQWKSETKLYHNTIYHSMDDTRRAFVPMHMDMPGWSKTTGFYHEQEYKKLRNHWKVRLDGHENFLRADMTMYPNNNDPAMYMQTLPSSYLKNLGLFVSYQRALNAHTNLELRSRLDHFKQFAVRGIGSDQALGMGYDIVHPQVNMLKNVASTVTRKLNKQLSWMGTVGYSERLPSSNERYGFYLFNRQDRFDYLGKPDLAIEKNIQTEIKLQYQTQKVEGYLQMFYHQIRDYIYPYVLKNYSAMTIGALGVKTYQNIPDAFSTGLEYGLQWRFAHRFQLNHQLRYLYTQTHDGKPLPLVSPLRYFQSLRYKIGAWQFQWDIDYNAKQGRTNRDFSERLYTPAYTLLHIRMAHFVNIKRHKIQWSLACENVFNKNYFDHLDIGYVPRMGRNFQVGLNYILF